MKHEATPGVVTDRIDHRRRAAVLAIVDERESNVRFKAHVVPTYDAYTGHPDGGTRSAVLGHACFRCGLSREAIQDLKRGDRCDDQRARWAAQPVDVGTV